MTEKEAYNLTRSFKGHVKIVNEPTKLKKIKIRSASGRKSNKGFRNIGFITEETPNIQKTILEKEFYKKYKKYFDGDFYSEDGEWVEHSYLYPKEPLYITSKGLTTEEDFFLATDIMENLETITTKDLLVGGVYRSILDKEYVFLGDLEIRFRDRKQAYKVYRTKGILYELKSKKLFYSSNIKLLEYLRTNNEEIIFSQRELEKKNDFKRNIFSERWKFIFIWSSN